MSKRIGRRRLRPRPAQDPLARLLDTDLARAVPLAAPETLHRLVERHGIDRCAEIVASATPAQLAAVFDLDLWRGSQPGETEHFDAERFGEWLELLVDAGEGVAAQVVAAMDEQLAVAGLSRYIRVFDPAAMVPIVEGEPVDAGVTSHRGPECDVGGYVVRGIAARAWDAIVALLVALEAGHPDRFHAVMRGCRRLSNSTPEVDGLDDLLTSSEQLLYDVALDRERRRSRQGYSMPADARAFLEMARRPRRPAAGEPPVNPLVAAYFRAAADEPAPRAVDAPAPGVLDAVAGMQNLAGTSATQPRALLEGAGSHALRFARLRTLLQLVGRNDDALYAARSQELAFLANTLAAGCSIQSRSFTPREALDAAAGVCNLGLEQWPACPDTFLFDHDLVSTFEAGWAVLHEQVAMFVAGRLLLALSDLRCSDAAIQEGLDALRIELARQRDAGTPWRARDALDALAMLDVPAWMSLRGLLEECPVIPAALTATLEGRTGAISATDFEFISTRSQLETVRDFMARFPDILLG